MLELLDESASEPSAVAHVGAAALVALARRTELAAHLLPRHAWATLVHRHPDVVLDFLRARLTEAPRSARPGLISTWSLPLAELLHLRSDARLPVHPDYVTTALP